jgi:hypothetical protein
MYLHAGVAYNGYLYTIGGCISANCSTITSTVFYASINSNGTVGSWSTTTALPTAIYDESAVAVNGYLYVTGGTNGFTTSTVRYAPINSNGTVGSWSAATTLPTTLDQPSMVAYNNYLYMTGGGTSTIFYAPILPISIGSGTIGAWLSGTTLPEDYPSWGSAVAANGYLYVTGGGLLSGVTSTVASIGLYTSCTAFVPTVANTAPSVSSVHLNHDNAIVLTANATTSFDINYTITDNDGCSDIVRSTSTAFRGGVSATCAVASPTTDPRNCYTYITQTTSSCSGTSINATDTVQLYWFADGTDSSSSYNSDVWYAYAMAGDSVGNTGSATSTGIELNTLIAINVTTSSINYSSVSANTNTGSTNQTATSTNAGNATTSLQLFASQTLVNGTNAITTSSQHYATSTFTFGGQEQTLGDGVGGVKTVTAFTLTTQTSSAAISGSSTIQKATFWGLSVPNGQASGTYTGTTVFAPLWQP